MITTKFFIKRTLFVLLLALLLVALGFTQKVKIEEKDGVVIVKNPKKPVMVPGGPTSDQRQSYYPNNDK